MVSPKKSKNDAPGVPRWSQHGSELREELGMLFKSVENVCVLEPDVGRLMNKLYVFKAEKPKKVGDSENGIKIVRIQPEKVFTLINDKELTNAYSIAALSIVLRRF